MALTGICLVLFVTFHVVMNAVALIWPAAYNQVCEFLGANWYALIASAGLALLFILHIVYALWLTVQNRAARGNDRYAVTARQPQVEWASKNMLVLGIVVLAFLAVHLIQFWAKMQWQELSQAGLTDLPKLDGVPAAPSLGTLFIEMAFKQWYTPVIYIIGFVALWFHMTHGFWSMFHTIGWDNNIWIKRLKTIGCWWTTIVVVLFVAQAIVFTVLARQDYYTKSEALQEQYAEYWNGQAEKVMSDFQDNIAKAFQAVEGDRAAMQAAQDNFVRESGPAYAERAELIAEAFAKQCPDMAQPQEVRNLTQVGQQLRQMLEFMTPAAAPEAAPAAPAADEAGEPAQNPSNN